ncbi:MAG: type II toxin-antitoxin system RelE/ParE family toxin [Eubacterium sp.]|nr:type II toxin-antitoxin system RelE/ParE family toxin [Eubacterium sp.]
MEIRYSKDSQKVLKGMNPQLKARIRVAINKLTLSPPEGDIKPMKGTIYEGCYRVRVGQYRIIYRYDVENTIEILYIIKIGPRGDIYK